MRAAKILAWLGLVAMSGALLLGFAQGDFFTDGALLLQNPWGIVSMVDLYTGFFLFSGWIIYREKSVGRAVVWVILMMVLGFFAASLYALIALYSSNNDWATFWMGDRNPATIG